MEGIIILFAIIALIVNAAKKGKKVSQNRPGPEKSPEERKAELRRKLEARKREREAAEPANPSETIKRAVDTVRTSDAMKRAREWVDTVMEELDLDVEDGAGQQAGPDPAARHKAPPKAGEGTKSTEGKPFLPREGASAPRQTAAQFSGEGRPGALHAARVSVREDEKPTVTPHVEAAVPHLVARSAARTSGPAVQAAGLRLSREQWRAAVVMSEILEKPVALRARKRMY